MLVWGGVWVGVIYLKQLEDIGYYNGYSVSGGFYYFYYRFYGGVDQVFFVFIFVVVYVKVGQLSFDEVYVLFQGVCIRVVCVQNMYFQIYIGQQ